ncbi:MAG: hypothetical protein V1904_09420, partial [Bacteroidota bacterium]
ACLVVGFAVTSFAQGGFSKIKVVTGDLNFLKGEKMVNVQYDFSEMKVGGFDEEDYVSKKVEEKNKKEAGSGDKWKEAWENDKTTKFEPKFEELMNKYLLDDSITVGQDTSGTNYTVILKTTFLEPGYNVGVSKKPAYINVDIIFVANSDPTKNLTKLVMTNVLGQGAMGYDYDTGYRISEAYAKCGKSLAAYIDKNIFNKK